VHDGELPADGWVCERPNFEAGEGHQCITISVTAHTPSPAATRPAAVAGARVSMSRVGERVRCANARLVRRRRLLPEVKTAIRSSASDAHVSWSCWARGCAGGRDGDHRVVLERVDASGQLQHLPEVAEAR
jgi:hypothetical protein